jgi:hypothetical protein
MNFARERSMRSLRWRFRLRTLLILIAVVATLMGAEMLRQRSVAYRKRAQFYRVMILVRSRHARTDLPPEENRRWQARFREWATRMERKYEYLALHPWESAPADPPRPK